MQKQLTDYLPKTEDDLMLVQAKVPTDLGTATRAILDARKLTWNDFVIAAMRKLVDESKRPSRG